MSQQGLQPPAPGTHYPANAPMPKGHGYGNNWRNEAEAKWRAKQHEKHQRAIAAQMGIQMPENSKQKRSVEDEPEEEGLLQEPDEGTRLNAWAQYYASMAHMDDKTPEERTQAEAWSQYYASQAAELAKTSAGSSSHDGGGHASKKAKPACSLRKFLAAVESGSLPEVRQQIGAGVAIDGVDTSGNTALHLAIQHNRPAILKEVLAAGPEIDEKNHEGLTALHVACMGGRKKLVEMLLHQGADPTLKTKDGRAPITLVDPAQRVVRMMVGDAAGKRFAH